MLDNQILQAQILLPLQKVVLTNLKERFTVIIETSLLLEQGLEILS